MIEILKESQLLEQAVLIAVTDYSQHENKTNEYLDELEFLASTINIETQTRFVQKLDRPDKRTYVGKGKLEEIEAFVKANDTNVLIFDDELSPSQTRNLEDELGIKIYDRSLLILDIFLFRAQTAQAKTQVELARSQYLLPRLTRMWTHLERQRGGTGTRGGSGEKELETDRRNIRNTITVLKQKLAKIDKQNETQRKGRDRMVRVALVGYTNVGKSTIMKLLSKSDVFAENKLFATVDSTVRKVVINNVPFLLSDTVGFIRKLPTKLIESFKSTLAEVEEANILIHVVDITHPGFEDQINVVNSILGELKVSDKTTLVVFNKIDALDESVDESMDELQEIGDEGDEPKDLIRDLQKSYLNSSSKTVFISASKKQNLDELRKTLFDLVAVEHNKIYPNYLKPDYY